MPNLYDITEEYEQVAEALENDPSADVEALLAEIEGELEDKRKAVIAMIRNGQADIDQLAAMKDRISKKKSAAERRNQWLREWLAASMQRTHTKAVKLDALTTARVHPGRSQVASIQDVSILPDAYKVTVVRADLVKIKEALDSGEAVPGARLITGDSYVVIR